MEMSSSILLDELFVEILSWVPVKDLMRLRCVSKSWNSLVFDPTFIKLHLQRSSRNTDILLTFRDYENDESRYCASPCSIHGFLGNPSSTIDACHRFNHDYTVLGVCNGLVCLQDSYRGDEIEEYWVRFWNPATRVMSEDSPRIRLRSSDYNYPYLFMFGFGYNDWSDTYQVVLLDNKSHKMDVSVLCLGETCWRKMLTCHSFPTLSLHGAAVSGTVNWLALPELCSGYRWETVSVDELVIFSYDLKNVRYSYLSMPDGLLEVPPDVPVLEVLKGCLCLSHHHGKRFVVWLMREFGVEKSWTHLLNISYENLHIHGFIHAFPTLPVILCVSEDDDLMLLANYDSAEFIRYNKRDDRIDRHELFNDDKFYFFSYDYVQSLVLPCRN